MKILDVSHQLLGTCLEKATRQFAESYLYFIRRDQRSRFNLLVSGFPDLYARCASEHIQEFMVPIWNNRVIEIEKSLLPLPRFGFLRNRHFRRTMFVSGGLWISNLLSFARGIIPHRRLRQLLIEDYVGMPIISIPRYLSSHNSAIHLHHILRFERTTGARMGQLNAIIEWGGGYGNMAKIIKRINKEITYTIIDIPLFSCLQWLYLTAVLGPDAVNLISGANESIKEGRVNLLPLSFLRGSRPNAQLFIATWSLSESSRHAQDYVVKQQYFGAEHMLLAFQPTCDRFPDAGRVEELAVELGANIEPVDYSPGHYYAFR